MEILKTVMVFLYQLTGDYGIAIVLLTVAVRCIMAPFYVKQRASLKGQQKLSEKVNQVKETYKNNQKKQQEEMQKLMAANKAGGAGCLISLLQLPIMLGLNSVIRTTITAGTTSVLLPGITSLLTPDPLFILPILTIIVQFLPQVYPYLKMFQELELQKTDKKMALIMVFSTGVIGVTLPSGIGLYYLASSLFSAVEQGILNIWEVRKIRKISVQ